MILVIRPEAPEAAVEAMIRDLKGMGLKVQPILGTSERMLGLAGDLGGYPDDAFTRFEAVQTILQVREPYKLAGRRYHPADTVVTAGNSRIGGGHFAVIAGPCSVESEDQILSVARDIAGSGATFLRGGAFKPRTSPYAFHGLGLDGLDLLRIARQKTGLPIVTEIMSSDYLDAFEKYVDVIQIGARNMQNFSLLRDVASLGKPVLLKRGLSSTIEELLMAAEYLLNGGTDQVVLCERGIRTFETATRNTLDLSAIPVLKQKTHLPVIADPSHGTGYWHLVEPMALAAVAAGADGLIIEVHNTPQTALCDGPQSITPEVFHQLMKKIQRVRRAVQGADSEGEK